MKQDRPLFVDVQASGNPSNGFLLEVAWKEPGRDLHSFLVRNTAGEKIPPRVKRITGISDKELESPRALDSAELKKLFLAAVENCTVLVAHYAVYEKRWLDFLTGLDLEFVCTREIAKAKIPDLPSGTLRAVAGAVGFSLGERRRARDHVHATEALYEALQSDISHSSLDRSVRLALPNLPGVYRFLGVDDILLYVGKAKNLRKRVNSHFTGRQKGRHAELISRTRRIIYETTETALDAAVLECQLISELSPQYNLAGRIYDGVLWYISGKLDKVSALRQNESWFGPFTSKGLLVEFSELNTFIEIESNKMIFVHNPWPEIDKSLLNESFAEWKNEIGNRSISAYGLHLHFDRLEATDIDDKKDSELVDMEYVKCKLNGLVEAGSLLCRKAALHRLLQGCEIQWNSGGSEDAVHKFVENSVNDHWSVCKLLLIKVLLAEVRRIYKEEKSIRIKTRFGTTITGDNLGYLLSVTQ